MQDRRHPVKRAGQLRWRARLGAALLCLLALGSAAWADAERATERGDERPVLDLPSPIGRLTYTPGRGVHVGDTGVTLGGYSNLNLSRDDGGPGLLSLDDLSLFFVWDPHPRFHLFSELEFEDLVQVDDHGHVATDVWTFTAERLFADVALTDRLSLRVGKFLTPVGRWNVIHAQPLVWTTTRPLATLLPFDPHTTGAGLSGWLAAPRGTLGYTLYGQFSDQLDPSIEPQLAHRSGGGRVQYDAWGSWSVGASVLAFSSESVGGLLVPTSDRWRTLTGVDLLWRRGPFEVMGEVARERGQWGLYLQGVVEPLPRVLPNIYLVGRYEHYDPPSAAPTVDMGVAGLAWKPRPYLIFKGEYLFSTHRAEESPPGFRSSIAVLF